MKLKVKNLILISIVLIILITILSLIRNYTLADNITFESQIYTIEKNYIKNISPNTTIDLYKSYFEINNCSLKIVDGNNEEITSNYIYNGSKTLVYDNSNNLIHTYTNIIIGDITEDGLINDNDLQALAKYLIENRYLYEYQLLSIDLNSDNEIKINDLTLLETYINSNYETITMNKEELELMTGESSRLIANITPNQILNQNAIWTSSDESIVKVNQAGIVTSYAEGEAIITATTSDGTLQATTKVTVDNTIKLSSTTGKTYIGGNNLEIDIKSLNYDNLTCTLSNPDLANCTIKDKKLIITGLVNGNTIITVNHPNYGTATFELQILLTYLNVIPKSWCLQPNTSYAGGRISIINAGTVSVKSISNREIITYASPGKNSISITSGAKTGDAEVVFTESNGNQTSTFTAYVYRLSLENSSGTSNVNGEKLTTKIISDNTGEITCTSENPSIATCNITNDELTITPISTGTVNIAIKGNKCGTITYIATIESEVAE